jgi:pyruvate dehydrogenase complex dehydrogenase (E1) component
VRPAVPPIKKPLACISPAAQQHEDGDSHIVANTIPNCISYDPTYAYELAVIVQSGLRRMYENH